MFQSCTVGTSLDRIGAVLISWPQVKKHFIIYRHGLKLTINKMINQKSKTKTKVQGHNPPTSKKMKTNENMLIRTLQALYSRRQSS